MSEPTPNEQYKTAPCRLYELGDEDLETQKDLARYEDLLSIPLANGLLRMKRTEIIVFLGKTFDAGLLTEARDLAEIRGTK